MVWNGWYPTHVDGQAIRVLVVEDNPHIARLLREAIVSSRRGLGVELELEATVNGRDALELLNSGTRFDAVLLDVYLPVLDGPSVIRAMRASETLREVPIIAMSAGGQSAQADALSAGADCFLAKPVRLAEIVATIRRVLSEAGRLPEVAEA